MRSNTNLSLLTHYIRAYVPTEHSFYCIILHSFFEGEVFFHCTQIMLSLTLHISVVEGKKALSVDLLGQDVDLDRCKSKQTVDSMHLTEIFLYNDIL